MNIIEYSFVFRFSREIYISILIFIILRNRSIGKLNDVGFYRFLIVFISFLININKVNDGKIKKRFSKVFKRGSVFFNKK